MSSMVGFIEGSRAGLIDGFAFELYECAVGSRGFKRWRVDMSYSLN